MPSVAGEPGAKRHGLVRIVLAELIDEGAGEDRTIAAVWSIPGFMHAWFCVKQLRQVALLR